MENPYQSPAAAAETAGAPVAGLKAVRGLALWSVWLYGLATLAQVVDHVWRVVAPGPFGIPSATGPAATRVDEKFGTLDYSYTDYTYTETYAEPGIGMLDWLMLATGLLSSVLYLLWKYRAATNARLLDPAAMPISPAMAVGSYFIPFVFFVVPCKAMAGIARASLGSAAGVGLWWGCQVGLMIFGIWLGLESYDAPYARPSLVEHAYLAGSVFTFLISGWLVLKITRAQMERVK